MRWRVARSSARALAAGTVAALVGCGGNAGRSEDTRPQAPLPRTAFEQADGARWTSLAEERNYLTELDRQSVRVRIAETGRSAQGRPIPLVVVGPPTAKARIAAGSSALFVCTQHGDEPAGREACLQRIRDRAASGDPSTLLVIPTANPDGVAADTRENAQGRDVNRDHLQLSTPEARFVARVMRDYAPDLLGDLHEYSEEGASDVLFQAPERSHPLADAAVRALSGRAVVERLRPALTRARFGVGTYGMGGEPDAAVLLQMAGVRHTVGALVETPRAGTLPRLRRVEAQGAAFDALTAMLRDQRIELAETTSRARRAASAAAPGTRGSAAGGQDPADETTCALVLSDVDREAEQTLALQGIRLSGSEGPVVRLAQPAGPVAALLLDPEGPLGELVERRLPC